MKHFTLFISLLFTAGITFSQSLHHCGSTEMGQKLREEYPSILIEEQKLNAFVRDWIANHEADVRDEEIYIIPIVFHVIHDYGFENISDDQVRDAVRVLNEDFRKRNADTTDIVSSFTDIAADVKIEFRLANKTPGGGCTNGIEHIHSLQTHIGNDGSKLGGWPRSMYLNVWTVKTMAPGVAGYAYLPTTAAIPFLAPYDGVIILSTYTGSIGSSSYTNSRALTHEIGHTMNLNHTWGGNNSPGVECGDDGVFDTPETEGWTFCNLNGQVCNPGTVENVQNYMEYAFCSRMFTEGQGLLMQSTLNSSAADRDNLWSQENLTATGTDDLAEPVCAPRIDFYSSPKLACVGTSIFFHDVSWGATVDSREWTFGDGEPATSTAKDPTVIFNTPGWKTITLTCSNAAGTVTETREQYLYISSTSAQYAVTYWETFENESSFTNEWIVQNPEGNNSKWTNANNAGYNSSGSAKLNNFQNMNGDIDNLITPSIDLSAGGTVYLNFRYSCGSNAVSSGNIEDELNIYSSSNCGQSWSLRGSIKGTDLANAGYYHYGYAPTATSEWIGESLLIPTAFHQPNVRFRFEYKTNGLGNNLYLDDIAVMNNPVGINDPAAAKFEISVVPNPFNDQAEVTFLQVQSSPVSIYITDLTGRIVKSLHDGFMAAGEQRFIIDASDLGSGGVYMLVADDGVAISRKKVVVQ